MPGEGQKDAAELLEGGAGRRGEVLIGRQGSVKVQLDLPGGRIRSCPTLLTQLETEQDY